MADLAKGIKGVWVWQKEYWWVVAINEVIRRKEPVEVMEITVKEVNDMIAELAGSVKKRLKSLSKYPVFVSLKGPRELIVKPD